MRLAIPPSWSKILLEFYIENMVKNIEGFMYFPMALQFGWGGGGRRNFCQGDGGTEVGWIYWKGD